MFASSMYDNAHPLRRLIRMNEEQVTKKRRARLRRIVALRGDSRGRAALRGDPNGQRVSS